MFIRKPSLHPSFVRTASFTLILGLVLIITANAAAGSGYSLFDSVKTVFGLSVSEPKQGVTASEPAVPLAAVVKSVCSAGGADFSTISLLQLMMLM